MTAINRGRELGDCWDDPTTIPEAMLALEGFAQPTAEATHPSALDASYDAVDQDCDAKSDFDQDKDGEASLYYGDRSGAVGVDCFDATSDVPDFGFENGGGFEPSDVNTKSGETWYDGTDQNCDGNEYDQDADGHDWDAFGGDDCNDENASISPDVVETIGDEIDANCDLHETARRRRRRRIAGRAGDTRASDTDCADANEGTSPRRRPIARHAGLVYVGASNRSTTAATRTATAASATTTPTTTATSTPRATRTPISTVPTRSRAARPIPPPTATIDRTATTPSPEIVGNGDDGTATATGPATSTSADGRDPTRCDRPVRGSLVHGTRRGEPPTRAEIATTTTPRSADCDRRRLAPRRRRRLRRPSTRSVVTAT